MMNPAEYGKALYLLAKEENISDIILQQPHTALCSICFQYNCFFEKIQL